MAGTTKNSSFLIRLWLEGREENEPTRVRARRLTPRSRKKTRKLARRRHLITYTHAGAAA